MKKLFICILVCLIMVGIMSSCESAGYRPTKISVVGYYDGCLDGSMELSISYHDVGYQVNCSVSDELDMIWEKILYSCNENGDAIKTEWFQENDNIPFYTMTSNYRYDSAGTIREREDVIGVERKITTYNDAQKISSVMYVNEDREYENTYVYDKNGNVLEAQWSGGSCTKYGYDKNGFLVSEDLIDGTDHERREFAYDGNGNVVSIVRTEDETEVVITVEYERVGSKKNKYKIDIDRIISQQSFWGML